PAIPRTCALSLHDALPISDQAISVKTLLDAVGFEVQIERVPTTGDLIQRVFIDRNFDMACWSVQLFDAAPWVKLDRMLRNGSPRSEEHTSELQSRENLVCR